MARPSNRDRILDAFETHVIAEGIGSLTLEGVAARAGVSKGGLLYHFPSKADLVAAFGDRLLERVDAVIADAPTDPEELIGWYLTDTPGDQRAAQVATSMLAALHANDAGIGQVVTDALQRYHATLDVLSAEVAELVRIVGDGLYLHALLGLPDADPAVHARIVRALLAQVDDQT